MTTVERLASEHLVVQAPLSFTGSAARCRRIVWKNPDNTMIKIAVWGFLLPVWWLLVAAWYCTFGLLVVPYRLIRRGQRKRKVEEARHREQLAHAAAIVAAVQTPAAPAAPPEAGV
jgi:hypothetical protein